MSMLTTFRGNSERNIGLKLDICGNILFYIKINLADRFAKFFDQSVATACVRQTALLECNTGLILQLAFHIQLDELRVAANRIAVNHDLWNRAAAGQILHFLCCEPIVHDRYFLKREATLGQQVFCRITEGAVTLGIHLYLHVVLHLIEIDKI